MRRQKTREEAMIEEMNDRHSKDLPPLHSENEDAEENGFSDLEHQSDTSVSLHSWNTVL